MTKKIGKFIFTTYLISWLMWGILILLTKNEVVKYGEVLFMILFIIGGNGPFLASFIIKNKRKNKEEYKEFIKELFKCKVNVLWYLFIIIMPFILFSIPWGVNYLLGDTTDSLLRDGVYMIFPLVLINIILGGLEEVGWRGILLPEFMKKYNKLTATIFTSIIWSIWHLPLWFIKGTSQQNINFLAFIILGLGFSLLLTTVYTRTKSILLAILLHSLINSYPSIVNMEISNLSRDSLVMLIYCIVVYFIFERFSHTNKKALSNND